MQRYLKIYSKKAGINILIAMCTERASLSMDRDHILKSCISFTSSMFFKLL